MSPRPVPTPTAPPRGAATGFADGVPSPAVVDRGGAHVAIAQSLAEYGRWLEWHDPDPALVDRAYAPNSALARNMKRHLGELRGVRRRVQEVDGAPLDFEVVSRLANVVSFRVTEHLLRRAVVDAEGRTFDHAGSATEHYLVLIGRFSRDAPWRLVVVQPQIPPIEVQL